jgi:hypothetical protein
MGNQRRGLGVFQIWRKILDRGIARCRACDSETRLRRANKGNVLKLNRLGHKVCLKCSFLAETAKKTLTTAVSARR